VRPTLYSSLFSWCMDVTSQTPSVRGQNCSHRRHQCHRRDRLSPVARSLVRLLHIPDILKL
jgi:hypothetical protein